MGLLGSFNSAGRAAGPIAGGVAYSVRMFLPYAVSAAISFGSALAMIGWDLRAGNAKKAGKIAPVDQ